MTQAELPAGIPGVADPCVIVIFGASGDLTARKLIPALYELHCAATLPRETTVLGISRSRKSDDSWRDELQPWARGHASGFDSARWSEFAQRVHYLPADATRADDYPDLRARIADLASEGGHCGNVLLYLSVAPHLYEPVIDRIAASDIVAEGRRWCSINRDTAPWHRIIIEKPFGSDLASAESLNRALGRVFEEDSIFRIDHYLGKELVQNILALRFANTIFEPVWNHRYVDHVQISATETIGVEDRASYYETSGALRDMIQSHLLQVLALVAMEPPTHISANHIRQEKIKILDAIEAPASDLSQHVCFGQYGSGDAGMRAYRDESDVAPDSRTDTFAAMRVQFANWRWAGTPFYLRSGKRLARKCTEIVVQFKQPAAPLFRRVEPFRSGQPLAPNRIRIEVAPNPGMSLRFAAKVPGGSLRLDTADMDFDLAEHFHKDPAEAYGPLLLDAMRGDQTLYPHRMEVEGAWRAVMPFLTTEAQPLRDDIAGNYPAGSWGPESADEMLARDGRAWHNPGD